MLCLSARGHDADPLELKNKQKDCDGLCFFIHGMCENALQRRAVSKCSGIIITFILRQLFIYFLIYDSTGEDGPQWGHIDYIIKHQKHKNVGLI